MTDSGDECKCEICRGDPLFAEMMYEAALRRIDALMDAAPDSPESAELSALADIVVHYEARYVPALRQGMGTEL